MRKTHGVLIAGACLLAALPATAQEKRPSEDEMFGGKAEPPKAAAPTPPAGSTAPPANAPAAPSEAAKPVEGTPPAQAAEPGTTPAAAAASQAAPAAAPAPADGRDEAILGGHESQMFSEEAAPSDPLRIGGQLYLRAQSTALRGQRFENYRFSAPSLVDVYFDARPNDRVRGFILGRLFYDPTLPTSTGGANGIAPVSATGGTAGSATLSSLFGGQTRAPQAVLDQLWLRFDVAHTVFVTAGKQHVRWGTGHFWSPTDFLHLSFRNPLDVFDARTGTTMIKLHFPVESKAWNFYAYGVTENPDATQTISNVAGAARAEFVFDSAELGLGAFVRRNQDPRIAADLSIGIGDFDLYGEVALKNSSEVDRVRAAADPKIQADATFVQAVTAVYPVYRLHDYRPQAVGGLSYSQKYNDNDTFTVGAEYFYNGFGYSDPKAYPGLVLHQDLQQPATFFYLGQHYGALYVTFPSPFKLDLHTFTLSTLGNLSDHSFVTRLDYSYVLLTHLRFEAFVSGHYGNEEGEFRFGVKPVSLGQGTPFSIAPSIFDVGVALRLAI